MQIVLVVHDYLQFQGRARQNLELGEAIANALVQVGRRGQQYLLVLLNDLPGDVGCLQ